MPTADVTVSTFTFVAESDSGVCGAIGLESFPPAGLLRSLVVDPDGRGAGVGRKLVSALERHARELGIDELWLLTIDADGYFETLGYVRRSRDDAPDTVRGTKEFSSLCPGDAVLMSKRLGA